MHANIGGIRDPLRKAMYTDIALYILLIKTTSPIGTTICWRILVVILVAHVTISSPFLNILVYVLSPTRIEVKAEES